MEKTISCLFCNGSAKLNFEELHLMNGKITLKDQPYYKCEKCKKEFVTSEQMLQTEKDLKTHFAFNRPIIATGRSLAITLPSDLVEYYKLKKGSSVRLIPEDSNSVRLVL